MRWQVSGVLGDSAEARRLGNMSASAASDKKSVGSISTRGFLKHFAASHEQRLKNIS